MACVLQPQPPLEEFERKIASLNISGQSFRITAQVKRLPGARDPDFGETVAAVEILDAAGKVHYRRALPYKVAGNRFADTLAVEARPIGRRGLLLTYSILPSAPLGGDSWQVFGVIGGRLVPFGKPIAVYGMLARAGEDAMELGVWTTNFFVLVPLALDWNAGRLIPPLPGGGSALKPSGVYPRKPARSACSPSQAPAPPRLSP